MNDPPKATVVPPASTIAPKRYRPYDLRSFRDIPEVQQHLTERQVRDIETVAHVFPFKTNNYVVEELIDWSRVPDDPMFVLTFPQRGMLQPEDHKTMERALREHPGDEAHLLEVANGIRRKLNPHPAGQMEHNVPDLYGQRLRGMQHKYKETVLFFPSQGQTCHAYCTFCFRWPQFVGIEDWKFAMKEADLLVDYLRNNPQVSDVLFTGGDPMVMKARTLRSYVEPLLRASQAGEVPNLRTIRIGTKSLTYWPYKYVTDPDADEVLKLVRDIRRADLHPAIMAHFNHPVELSTPVVKEAVGRLRRAGAVVRSQTPVLRGINDDAAVWAEKWRREVNLGVVPYYMFVVRDTGAQHYFGVPLVEAWRIYREAYQQVSGLCRTVRGPSMSADPGKVEVLGPVKVAGKKALALRFLQGRDPQWVDQVFFAKYDEEAAWLNELQPAFSDRFFFEDGLDAMYAAERASGALPMAEAEDGATA